jgi:hypothetical protein
MVEYLIWFVVVMSTSYVVVACLST